MMTRPPSYKDGELTAYVYLLRSLKTLKFYIGWTANIKRRLYQHNQGETMSTKSYCPWELIGYETYINKEEAKEREKSLKRNRGMQYFFKKRLLAAKEVVRVEKIILMICGMILISGNFAMAGTKGNNKEKKVDTEKVQKAKDLENKPLGVLINQVRNIKDRSKRNIYYKVIRKKLPKTKEEKQLIRKFLKDDNADNKIFAMEILARIKEKTVVPTLIKNLKHKDNRVRVTAAVALGKIGDKRGVRPLLENIDLMNLEFGYCPVAEIGALALPELIKAAKKTSLLGLLPKKERKDKRSRRAADCIGDIRDEKAIPELMKLLKDDDADVRLAAVRALAGMKVKEANSEFKKMLNDSDERVRMSTLRTLAKADKTKYLPKVFETVQEKKGYEKGHAIKLIGDLGAKEFIPKLKELLKDTNEYTRHDAAYSLWKITGKAYPYKRGRDTLHSEQFWKKRLKDARGPGRDHESPRNAIQEAQKNGFLLDEKVE